MKKDLLGLEELSEFEILEILDEAKVMRSYIDKNEIKLNLINNVSMVNLFYENSTRTRTSFENAAKFLGVNCVNVSVAQSSVAKGESLLDTAWTLNAIKNNIIVIRHNNSGTPQYLAKKTTAHVINAGDGMHEHPTQGLLDMFTMREYFGTLSGLKVAIIGDIKFSRVARSNIYGLNTMGAEVRVFAPTTLLPEGIEKMGVVVCKTVEEAISGVDVVMALRIQLERQDSSLLPSAAEYFKEYGIDSKRLKLAKPNVIVMHPGPVNRGVELSDDVIDGKQSKILEQVTNGLAVRMAIINLMAREDFKCF